MHFLRALRKPKISDFGKTICIWLMEGCLDTRSSCHSVLLKISSCLKNSLNYVNKNFVFKKIFSTPAFYAPYQPGIAQLSSLLKLQTLPVPVSRHALCRKIYE